MSLASVRGVRPLYRTIQEPPTTQEPPARGAPQSMRIAHNLRTATAPIGVFGFQLGDPERQNSRKSHALSAYREQTRRELFGTVRTEGAASVELAIGVNAERRPLEHVARPLSQVAR